MQRWTTTDMPTQTGRTAVVTGTGGLGFEDALALARAGASVILAGRNPDKGATAVGAIEAQVPGVKIRFERLDLANLASIADFASRLTEGQDSLDLLINNAGVMIPPQRQETADGFELQLGTNYLGHYALTGRLLPLLRRAKASRVVTLSSIAARGGHIDFDDLQARKTYRAMQVYSQSKLACLVFALDLDRRSKAAGWGVTSIGAHPGVARTDLMYNSAGRWSAAGLARTYLWFLFQPVAQGALPTLYAATSPQAKAGGYYGPDQLSEFRGYPTDAKVPPEALAPGLADRLWQVSEDLTGVRFDA
jgi:NAD(P)-dependent dehydrogenase (short-subunit alcohol dehydrogenase family)